MKRYRRFGDKLQEYPEGEWVRWSTCRSRLKRLVEAIQHCDEWHEHENDCATKEIDANTEMDCDCLYRILHAAVEAAAKEVE